MYTLSLDFHRHKDIRHTYTRDAEREDHTCVSYVCKPDISGYVVCIHICIDIDIDIYILLSSLFRRRKDIRSRLWPLTDSMVSAWKEEEEEEECLLTVQNK
jgi:hypothetical protein